MGDFSETGRLDKRELGELLELIGRRLAQESSIPIQELEGFLEKTRSRRGELRPTQRHFDKDILSRTISFLENFKGANDLRDFIEVTYKLQVPYKLGKQVLLRLGVGVVLTSKLDFDEARMRWLAREDRLRSTNIYQMSKDQLREILFDEELFPSGYSIVTFAKRFQIRLPIKKDRTLLVNLLFNQLLERPSSSRKIGHWGLKDQREGSE